MTDNIMAKCKRTKNENTTQKRSSNTSPTKYRGWTQVLWKGQQFMLHIRHSSCYCQTTRTSS